MAEFLETCLTVFEAEKTCGTQVIGNVVAENFDRPFNAGACGNGGTRRPAQICIVKIG